MNGKTTRGGMVWAPKKLLEVADLIENTEAILGRSAAFNKIAILAERKLNEDRRMRK